MDINITSSQKELSQRRLEEYDRYCKIINCGRKNPIWFAEEFFGLKLMDYQKWCFMNSWTTPFCCWLNSRGAGKTTLAAVLLMTKTLLIPNYTTYISTNSSSQSIESFKKLEDIALQRIPTFESATDIFVNEIEKTANSDTGFIHNPAGYRFRLYNNSQVITLSSNITTARGKRGSVFFDECGWQSADQIGTLENFINVDTSFNTSTNKIKTYKPKQVPLQLLYASSASDVSFPFYEKYITFSKKMFLGNSSYFVCDLNCDTILHHSTIDGEHIKSHLTEDQINKSIEEDKDTAMRELYNKFSSGYGENQVIRIETLIKNSTVRPPLLYNDTGKRKFIFCYDPARNFDGSVLSIFEIVDDKKVGYKLILQNVVSMVDKDTKNKTPLPMTEQLKIIKELMIKYNGERSAEWENIDFYIDSGSGGGGISAVADQLMADWKDKIGQTHKGIIDPEHKQYETSRKKYVNAMPIVHLIDPQGYKKVIYDALEKMTKLDLINFPDYDNKDCLIMIDEHGESTEYKLSFDEQMSLVQCNLAKNELIYMNRYDSPNGGVQYELAKDKKSTMHDDRAYTMAMGAYALALVRRTDLIKVNDGSLDFANAPQCVSSVNF